MAVADAAPDALAVVEERPVVDPAPGPDEYVEDDSRIADRQVRALVGGVAVEDAEGRAVGEDVGAVAQAVDAEGHGGPRAGDGGAVVDQAVALSEPLHGLGGGAQYGGAAAQQIEAVEEVGAARGGGEGGGDPGQGPGRRCVGQRHVLADDLAEGMKLGGELAGLADGCVVVVAGDGGLVAGVRGARPGVVGSGPEAEVGTAVGHVEVHRRAGGEEFVQ